MVSAQSGISWPNYTTFVSAVAQVDPGEEAWSLDRELLDKVALALNWSPYFLLQHLEYQGHRSESSFPDPLECPHPMNLSLEVGWTSPTGSVGCPSFR